MSSTLNNSEVENKVADYGYYTHKLPKQEKLSQSLDLTNSYYNIATDLYQFGWGQSFHFSNSYEDDTFEQALTRHQHFLAKILQLNESDKVLDVGCGIGGPLREMIKLSNCHVTGLNNNKLQIDRASKICAALNLSDRCSFVKGDFMNMDGIQDKTFDKVYAIEATCHASDLLKVYREINRVVKPNGLVGIYEWCMTDKYIQGNELHERIKSGIERGDGIADLKTTKYAKDSFEAAGFEIIQEKDLSLDFKGVQWYQPLEGRCKDGIKGVLRKKNLRFITQLLMYLNELVGLVPKGSAEITNDLQIAQDCLIEGAKLGIFTPMYLLLGRKKQ